MTECPNCVKGCEEKFKMKEIGRVTTCDSPDDITDKRSA